jgi:hypothetical protein
MSKQDAQILPSKIIFPKEAELESETFRRKPIEAIAAFLSCFDQKGVQRVEVPRHVLESLAALFGKFWNGEASSLDAAFGGKIAQRRNSVLTRERDCEILWDFINEVSRIREDKLARSGTPFEMALDLVAEKHRISPETVRKIYKRLGVPNS